MKPVPCNAQQNNNAQTTQHKTQLAMHANYAAQITIKQPITKNTLCTKPPRKWSQPPVMHKEQPAIMLNAQESPTSKLVQQCKSCLRAPHVARVEH